MNEKHFDLVVVGAGVIGTFHAYHAARLGKKVLLTEKDQLPQQATVRNFGQIVPSGMAAEWFEFGKRGLDIYTEIQKQCDLTVRNNGSVYIASDDDEVTLLHELKAIMDGKDYEARLLTSAQCRERWPAVRKEYVKEALFFPQEISVDPDKMVHRLLEFISHSFPNFIYRPSTTVVGCSPSGQQVIVSTSDGQLFTAEKVVVCNGGEFKLLFPDLFRKSRIVISKLQMLKTIPMPDVKLDGNILTGLSIRRYESFAECASYKQVKVPASLVPLTDFGIHILFKKATDHSIIIGDSHEYAGVNESDSLGFELKSSINEAMLAEAARIVDFDVRAIADSWAGFYPQHPDKDVVEIDLEDCIHIRTAVGGKGMTSGAGYAEKSIQKIFGLS